MFAVTGSTGKVGGRIVRGLLAKGFAVRAIVRSREKGRIMAALGCEIAVADIEDAAALTAAFRDTQGVFVMNPPNYDPEPGFPDTHRAAAAVETALRRELPGKVVFLSTIGAQVLEPNLLNNARVFEEMLNDCPVPAAILRPAWFMENAGADIQAARNGMIFSFLQPLDHSIPMVATADIARAAIMLLTEEWTGRRVVELEGPNRYSANGIAEGFATALDRSVIANAVPRNEWEALFRSQGMKHPTSRMRMLDGFNEGWLRFEGEGAEHRRGDTELHYVLNELVQEA